MKALLSLLSCIALLGTLPAQDAAYADFVVKFSRGLEYDDAKAIDKVVKAAETQALRHFEGLCWNLRSGKTEPQKAVDALFESWERLYGSRYTLEKYKEWVDYLDLSDQPRVNKVQNALMKVFELYGEVRTTQDRQSWEALRESAIQVADRLSILGHVPDASIGWSLVAEIDSKMPKRSIEDRKDEIFARQRFMEVRDSWQWNKDPMYIGHKQALEADKHRLAAAEEAARKRKEEGYGEDAEGVDGLVMPDAKEEVFDVTFAMLEEPPADDYYVYGGPVPQLWFAHQFSDKDPNAMAREGGGRALKMVWFQRLDLYMIQKGAAKFSIVANDPKGKAMELAVGTKPKPTLFHLDGDQKVPYAFFCYMGTDKDIVIGTQVNLQPTPEFAAVFYKSAASWTADIHGEQVTFYDDNGNGKLFDKDPTEAQLKIYTAGEPTEGVVVPTLDSMRIGSKGRRQPYSEFVKLADGWYHMRGSADDSKPGIRKLNPEYFKTGTVQMKWQGGKKVAPQIVAIRRLGSIRSVFFDIASGDPVEVPTGKYELSLGRIVIGKGAKIQMATILRGEMEEFEVKAGEATTVELGGGWRFDFEKGLVKGNDVTFDTTSIRILDAGGAVYINLQGAPMKPDVVTAKNAKAKRTKKIGSLVLVSDADFINDASKTYPNLGRLIANFPKAKSARKGNMKYTGRIPKGAVIGLQQNRHPLFGRILPILK